MKRLAYVVAIVLGAVLGLAFVVVVAMGYFSDTEEDEE